ncbi:hypothetical protein C8Q80DRAFT_1232578 [Daedaleopsis nitida]|nr:hypothetical protein C8Q80DRAFT_1232578 [Daedaleopsis nitida]
MTTAQPPRTSPSPRWDNLNEGFVSPARLQQWKQEHERVHSLGNSVSQAPINSPPPPDLTANRPALDRRNTSNNSYASVSTNANGSGSPSKHRPKNSFSALFSRKSSHQDEASPPLFPPSNQGPPPGGAPIQSQQSRPPLSPRRNSVFNGNMEDPTQVMHQQQQQQSPPQQPEPGPQTSPPAASGVAAPQPPPLHPEIRSVVQLTQAHSQKVYFSGPLVRRIERQPDGQRPTKDEGWREVWAQLGGTTLSVWDMAQIQEASQQGKQVPPTYINITDAFVNVLGSIALPPTPGAPQRRFTNVITLNTAGSNLYLFSCPSAEALVQWTAAIRLSAWEKSRLEEIYTAHLIRITLNDGRSAPSSLTNGRLEGWVRIRIAGQTDWKRHWMVISAGSPLGHPEHGSISSVGHERPGSPDAPRKKRMSNIFLRDKNAGAVNLPARPMIQIYNGSRPKEKKKALLTMRAVTQAFAVYPERPELISRSTLMKLEGQLGDEEMAGSLKMREAWLLVMPELEGTNTRASEMLRWIISIHDAFELYGRPRIYSWDPRDVQSMMFAYPIGPHRDLLFLDREFAETLDARDDRTSAIRAQLQRILLDRMRGLGPDGPPGPPPSQQTPTLPTIPTVSSPNGPPQPAAQTPGVQPQSNGASLQLPPLSFDSSPINAESQQAQLGRPLSTITERSTPMEGRSMSVEKSSSFKTQLGFVSSPPRILPEEAGSQTILEQPLVSSPTASSPPPDRTIVERGSTDSQAQRPGSRPDSKLSQRPGQMSNFSSYSRPSMSYPSSPTPPPDDGMRTMSPELRSNTPPRFSGTSPRESSPSRNTTSPLRAASPPQPKQRPSFTAPAGPPPTSIRMVPDRSVSQASIPVSMYTIPTPTSRGSYTKDPWAATPEPPLQSPPLEPTGTPAHEKKASLTDDILGDAGAALFYMQHMQQGDADPVRKRGPPPPTAAQNNDEDSPSESESEPYTPPPRATASQFSIQHTNSPPPPPPPSASPQPPVVPAKSPKPKPTANQVSTPVPASETASRPGSGLRNRPSGARAAPSTRMSAYIQNSFTGDQSPTVSTTPSTSTTTSTKTEEQPVMAPAQDPAGYDDNADALAALTFLEQDDRPAPPPPSRGSATKSPTLPEVVETPASPSKTRGGASEQPRSSFAPTRLVAERKAKSQAQQAAQQAAAHRPGKANGRARAKPKDGGAWGDSSEEEEEEDEEDDEDVDSDEEPPLRSAASVSDHNSAMRSPYSNMGPGSPARSGSAVDVSNGAYPPSLPPRILPQVPGGRYPDEYLGAQPQPRRFVSDNFTDGGRRSLYPAESTSRGASPQYGQSGPQGMRPQSQFPMQGQPAQQQQGPQRAIWSQVLDPGRHAEPTNTRDTFIQMEAPATTMTKAFTPHGLLSAGMQDKQDRSAKRQEELARETGASLINVPNKPPPPQTGLLGAVTAHERERKREGGLGAALTEREREKRLVEERQRKIDDLQRQQLDQMQQGGSMYGGQMMGFNPMMGNPMMMGMNPMMTGGWGYPGMMPGFANPQQLFAAQQAAQQAYQQAMVAFSTAGSQIGGGGDGPSPGAMGSMNPMMTGGSMGMGGFDPRMSMMGMPMMNTGMGMGPMGMTPTGMNGMGGMGGGMGMGGAGSMGGMNGMNPMMGGGMGMQMTGVSQFDPRFSPGLEGAAGKADAPRQLSSNPSSPAPGKDALAAGHGPGASSSDGSGNASGPLSSAQ